MALNIEKKIETAWKTTIAADTYITTNNIPVYGWRDVSHVAPQKCVVVKAGACENENNVSGTPGILFKCEVEIFAVSYTPDDKSRAALEAIYQAILGVTNTVTKATLNTNSTGGIAFCGFSQGAGTEADEERVQMISTKVECHVQSTS